MYLIGVHFWTFLHLARSLILWQVIVPGPKVVIFEAAKNSTISKKKLIEIGRLAHTHTHWSLVIK